MLDFLIELNPILQALLAGLFTYAFTALGSAVVLLFKKINKNILDAMMALSGGVMIAASFFSLINPAIEKAENLGQIPWLILSSGFLLGGLLLFITDKVASKFLKSCDDKRNLMLISSITIHNIPEGLVVGLAFGSLIYGNASLISACLLALGIGIQNFPEGSSISLPLRRSGMSRGKAFFFGQISGIVEPIASVIGALLVAQIEGILPISLAFAAGAMIYVVVEEIIPESQTNKRKDLMTYTTLIGFVIMMILDLALG